MDADIQTSPGPRTQQRGIRRSDSEPRRQHVRTHTHTQVEVNALCWQSMLKVKGRVSEQVSLSVSQAVGLPPSAGGGAV